MSTETIDGFLLTRQWFDGNTLTFHLWVQSKEGPLCLEFDQQEAVFFVNEDSIEKARQVLTKELGPAKTADQEGSWYDKALALRSFDYQKVHGVYFKKQRLIYRARDLLKKWELKPLEADVNPLDRFLMERFITGSLRVIGQGEQRKGYKFFRNPKIKKAAYEPSYTIVSLDIETSMTGDHLYSIALLVEHSHDKAVRQKYVLMIGDNDNENSKGYGLDYLYFYQSEHDLMQSFMEIFQKIDPDIVIGWAVVNFDFRFLQKKADQLKTPLALGRGGDGVHDIVCDWRQSRDNEEHYTLLIPGRLVLDGIDTLRSATYSFESFSLQNVSNELLNRGKLIKHVDNRGHEITELFLQDKKALAEYNLEDCQLVWDIFVEADLFNFAIERAQLTGLAMDRFGGSVAAFDNRYLPKLHRQGYVAPSLIENPEGIGSPGGYVMSSEPGLYHHVLVLDFKSLYPSIIRTFKIDPLALVAALERNPLEARKNQQESTRVDIRSIVPGFNGAHFSKTENLLPQIIDELWAARDAAKSQNNAAMSQAIKILMNSFYGVLGTPGCRFFDSRLPSSITLRGHQILTQSKEYIESKGYRVIYGDTDSIFVWLENENIKCDPSEIQKIGSALAAELNQWWHKKLKEEYDLESYLEMEFETHFQRFIMPTIRGSDKGSKKRYAGLVQRANRSGGFTLDMTFKGLETVRTDWTNVAREFQKELYRRIFFEEEWESYVKQAVEEVREGKRDEALVYRKRIRRPLVQYQKNVPPQVQAARIADNKRQEKGLPRVYEKGGWIEYVWTVNGPEPIEYISSPLDYDLYIERQLEPVADGILQFLGASFRDITDRQIGMF